jgi:signal transduction histidine kinase
MITRDSPGGPATAAAPISYSEVRRPGRISRACLGTALLTLAAVGWAAGIPGAPLKAAVAAVILLHALLDFPPDNPLPGLSLDALLLCGAVGIGGEIHGPLVGAVAYLLAAATLLLPARQVPVALAAVTAGVGLRLFVLRPAAGAPDPSAPTLAGIESALYLLAFALLILGAAHSFRRARRRQAEALAAEQRAATIKNEFVSMVSHELRTPLTNIAGFTMALREAWRTYDPAEVDEFLEVVRREADHLRALVDDVLVVPRLEAGRLPIEPADFSLRPAVFRIAGLVFPPGGEKSASVSVSGSAASRSCATSSRTPPGTAAAR